jgi:hypothetical protein
MTRLQRDDVDRVEQRRQQSTASASMRPRVQANPGSGLATIFARGPAALATALATLKR